VVQRRRGLGALACRLTAWAQSARQPPACWSRLPAGRTGQYKGDFVPATSTVCVGVQDSGKDGAVSAGTVPHNVRIGVSWEADRPKVIFLAEKIRRALAKLNPEERMLFSCLKAIPSWTGSSGSGTW
jgi:hypothetical protein